MGSMKSCYLRDLLFFPFTYFAFQRRFIFAPQTKWFRSCVIVDIFALPLPLLLVGL